MSQLKYEMFVAKEIKSIDDKEGIIEARISSETKDRDGDIVSISGIDIKQYKQNPVVLWAHQYNQLPIGKALRIWKIGTDLMASIKFAISESPFASEVYRLYKGGFLNAFSIGFIPKDVDEDTNTIIKSEMLEFSAVPVPANAEALVVTRTIQSVSKSIEAGKMAIKDIKEKDLKSDEENEWDLKLSKCNDVETTKNTMKELLTSKFENQDIKENNFNKLNELYKKYELNEIELKDYSKEELLEMFPTKTYLLEKEIQLLKKSVSALEKQVGNNAGGDVKKLHKIGKIASQSIEGINKYLKGV